MVDLKKFAAFLAAVILVAVGLAGRKLYEQAPPKIQAPDTTWHDIGHQVQWKVLDLADLGWDCVVFRGGARGAIDAHCERRIYRTGGER